MTYTPPNANGSATSAASAPVVVASDQATLPVSLASVPSHAVTNAGTFAVQAAGADGANVTLGAKTDAKNTATDATSITGMQVLKQISASVQAPPSQAVTNAGTFVAQATLQTQTDTVMVGGVNIKEINAVAPLMGNGVTGTGSLRVTLASDTTSNTNPLLTRLNAQATGGATSFTLISAATTNATLVKASAGTLYSLNVYNNGAGVAYFKLFNKASAPTVGTDIAVMTVLLPIAGGSAVPLPPMGVNFSLGIAYSITGVGTTADTTAVALSQVYVNGSFV